MNTQMKRLAENVNTVEFITQIEKYPAIWNVGCNEYGIRPAKRRAWEKVINCFVPDFQVKTDEERNFIGTALQKKWKSLRNSYARELAKQKTEKHGPAETGRKQYIYFDQLRFLGLSSKTTVSSLDEDDIPASPVEVSLPAINYEPIVNREETLEVEAGIRKRKRICDQSDDDDDRFILEVLKQRITQHRTHKDEDELFMMSMVPEIKKVVPEKRLALKAKIINCILAAQQGYSIVSVPKTSLHPVTHVITD